MLAGVDLDSGYLFGLSLSATRDGEAWAELLREGQAQGLGLSVVVKDAARGIAAGVSEVFPHAEQRDDCFHVLYEMHKVRRRLERRAYAAIEREGEALGRLGKIRACDKVRRRKAKRARSGARRECAEAIERFDAFEAAMDTLRGALECVDLETGELHRPEHVEALIEGVAQRIPSRRRRVGECAKPSPKSTCATGRRAPWSAGRQDMSVLAVAPAISRRLAAATGTPERQAVSFRACLCSVLGRSALVTTTSCKRVSGIVRCTPSISLGAYPSGDSSSEDPARSRRAHRQVLDAVEARCCRQRFNPAPF